MLLLAVVIEKNTNGETFWNERQKKLNDVYFEITKFCDFLKIIINKIFVFFQLHRNFLLRGDMKTSNNFPTIIAKGTRQNSCYGKKHLYRNSHLY